MHRLLALLQVLLLGAAATVAAVRAPAPPPTGLRSLPPMSVPDERLALQRGLAGDELTPAERFELARGQALEIGRTTETAAPGLAAAQWRPEGPANIGGRVVDLAVDPVDPDTLYVAAASGGIWKSTDAGDTFESIWPDDFGQGMGAVAVTPDGTLFAGTGEANPGGGSIVFGGSGVYRSTDGGGTWQRVGLADSGAIGEIVVDPTDADRILVAAAGNLFTPGGDRGLYESTDGGDTWTLLLAPDNDTTGAVDIALDPTDPDRIFVAMWDHLREPNLRRYGGPGSGLYRTDDGGQSWVRLGGNGALGTVLGEGLPAASDDVGRIGVALAPSAPNVVYAIVITAVGPFEGFYRSVDGGDTWVETSVLGDPLGLLYSQSTFGWWFGRVWVDPVDPDGVFVAGVSLVVSRDGGLTFTPHTGPHADQHALAFSPHDPTRVYLGNDGGVWRHDQRALVNSGWTHASSMPWNQFYSVDVSQQDGSRLVGGAQDNGCLRNYNGTPWNSYCGGDGLATLINPVDQTRVYGCSQYGNCSRSTNGGDSMSNFTSATQGSRRNWFAPLVFDPTDPDVMYYGSEVVNRSTDGGATWTAISGDLTAVASYPNEDPSYPFNTLTTIAPSPADSSVVWAGSDDGRIHVTTAGGGSWRDVTPGVVDGRWITRIAADPAAPGAAVATVSGFRSGDDAPLVLSTTDFGQTWTDLGAGLPAAPVNDVVTVDAGLLVATDVGVFLRPADTGQWLRVGTGLPMAPVTDLVVQRADGQVVAATFGRGIWRVELAG